MPEPIKPEGPEENSAENLTPKNSKWAEIAKLPATIESGEKKELVLTAEAVKKVLENDLNVFGGSGIAYGPAHSEKEIGDYFEAKADKILRDKFPKLFSEGTKLLETSVFDSKIKADEEAGPYYDVSSHKVYLQLGTEAEYYSDNNVSISFLYTYMGDGVSPVISDLHVSDISTKSDFFSKRTGETK